MDVVAENTHSIQHGAVNDGTHDTQLETKVSRSQLVERRAEDGQPKSGSYRNVRQSIRGHPGNHYTTQERTTVLLLLR